MGTGLGARGLVKRMETPIWEDRRKYYHNPDHCQERRYDMLHECRGGKFKLIWDSGRAPEKGPSML